MKQIYHNRLQVCEGCEGSSMQINEYGILRQCPVCAKEWTKFSNQYGTDLAGAPVVYYDQEQKILVKVDERKSEIILPNGLIIPNK